MSNQLRKNLYDLNNGSQFTKLFGNNDNTFLYNILFMAIIELAAIFKNHARFFGLGNRFIQLLQESQNFDSEGSNGPLFPYINQILQTILSASTIKDAVYYAHWYCDQEESYPYYTRAMKAILLKEFQQELPIQQKIYYDSFEDIKKYLIKLSKALEICINYSENENLKFEKFGLTECPNIFLTGWSNGSFWVVYHQSVMNFFTYFQESELENYPFIHPNEYISRPLPVTQSQQINPGVPINPSPSALQPTQANPLVPRQIIDSDFDSSSSNSDKIIDTFDNIKLNYLPETVQKTIPEPVKQQKERPALNFNNLYLSDAFEKLQSRLTEPRIKTYAKKRNYEKKIRPVLNFGDKKYVQVLNFSQSELKSRADDQVMKNMLGNKNAYPDVQNVNNRKPLEHPRASLNTSRVEVKEYVKQIDLPAPNPEPLVSKNSLNPFPVPNPQGAIPNIYNQNNEIPQGMQSGNQIPYNTVRNQNYGGNNTNLPLGFQTTGKLIQSSGNVNYQLPPNRPQPMAFGVQNSGHPNFETNQHQFLPGNLPITATPQFSNSNIPQYNNSSVLFPTTVLLPVGNNENLGGLTNTYLMMNPQGYTVNNSAHPGNFNHLIINQPPGVPK